MSGAVLVFVEVRPDGVKRPSLEAVSEGVRLAESLGTECAAVVVAPDPSAAAAEAGRYGVKRVYTVADERLGRYAPEAYAKIIVEAQKKTGAETILFAATAMGKDLAPTVAARFETTPAVDCIEIKVEGGRLRAKRPVIAGKALLTLGFTRSPAVLSLRPNVFDASPKDGASAETEVLPVNLTDEDFRSAVKETTASPEKKVELTEASVIVSGGRGLKGPENFHLRDQLAGAFGAAVGASRAVVDAGWRPYAEQVGQTGKTVSPNLYVALGISGAIQHLAGMSSSKVIVAVNTDPEAPIFKVATYGIVGDVFEVCPVLAEEVKKALGKQ